MQNHNQNEIRAVRELLGLTQLELAGHLRLSRDLLAQVEIGRRTLPTAALIRLAPLLTLLNSGRGAAGTEPPLLAAETDFTQPQAAEAVRGRLQNCQHEVMTARMQLAKLQEQATRLRRRFQILTPLLAALPALPAAGSPDPDARDRGWYTDQLATATAELGRYGALPQALLQARIKALDTEIADLQLLVPAGLPK
jgi:transcriptional regulator with XRE-family HTH domain